MQKTRTCSTCQQVYPLTSEYFHRNANDNSGLSYGCKECRRNKIKTQYTNDPIVRERMRQRSQNTARSERLMALTHYSDGIPYCKCCGERELVFLVLDHINNDGSQHRKTLITGGRSLYRWAIANDFPNNLQVLCHNCNWAKQVLGSCPHQQKTN